MKPRKLLVIWPQLDCCSRNCGKLTFLWVEHCDNIYNTITSPFNVFPNCQCFFFMTAPKKDDSDDNNVYPVFERFSTCWLLALLCRTGIDVSSLFKVWTGKLAWAAVTAVAEHPCFCIASHNWWKRSTLQTQVIRRNPIRRATRK